MIRFIAKTHHSLLTSKTHLRRQFFAGRPLQRLGDEDLVRVNLTQLQRYFARFSYKDKRSGPNHTEEHTVSERFLAASDGTSQAKPILDHALQYLRHLKHKI